MIFYFFIFLPPYKCDWNTTSCLSDWPVADWAAAAAEKPKLNLIKFKKVKK